jgi:hypothetical protein
MIQGVQKNIRPSHENRPMETKELAVIIAFYTLHTKHVFCADSFKGIV